MAAPRWWFAPGFLQEAALKQAAIDYPDTKFIFVDGYPIKGDDNQPLANVAGIAFKEEQSGYFAGYAAVMEGYTKLGFSGGGGGTNPACCRYGYGFVQGATPAAAEKDDPGGDELFLGVRLQLLCLS